jgi:hypothetical protein
MFDGEETKMGEVVPLSAIRRVRRRPLDPAYSGEITFFTGVRVERWCELAPERPDPNPDPPPASDTTPRSSRGGRRRRKTP